MPKMDLLVEKVAVKYEIDIKNIENRFGEAKIGGESLPLAPATPSWRASTRHLAVSSATPSPRGTAPKTPISVKKVVAKRKIGKKNIENGSGGAKMGG